LCAETVGDFEKVVRKANALYSKRSSVIHGDTKRSRESWYLDAATACEDLSRTVLFTYLYVIPYVASAPAPTDRKKLGLWLKRLDDLANEYRRKKRR
jgi:hypothetical protein